MKEKLEFSFGLCYPMRYLFQKEVANRFQDTGMFMSAYELLDQIDLTAEAIKCLAIAGRQTEAIKKSEKFIEELELKGQTSTLAYADMLCTLGDIK